MIMPLSLGMTRDNKGDLMNVYALFFQIGIEHGHEILIGLYDSEGKAKKVQEQHMKTHAYGKHHYGIKEVKLNEEVNIMFHEW